MSGVKLHDISFVCTVSYPMSDGVKDSSGCEIGSSCGVLIAFKRGASKGSEVEVLLLLLLLLPDPLNHPLNKLELSAGQQAITHISQKIFGASGSVRSKQQDLEQTACFELRNLASGYVKAALNVSKFCSQALASGASRLISALRGCRSRNDILSKAEMKMSSVYRRT